GNRNRGARGVYWESQPAEVAQFHQFGFARVALGKFRESLIYGEHVIVRDRRGHINVLQIQSLLAPAVASRVFATCIVDENAAHCLGRCAEKMSSILPSPFLSVRKPQPGFVDQRSRLQSLSRWFMS